MLMPVTNSTKIRIGTVDLCPCTGDWDADTKTLEILGVPENCPKTLEYRSSLQKVNADALVSYYFNNTKGSQYRNLSQIVRPCDGEDRWILTCAYQTQGSQDEPVIFKGHVFDVTEGILLSQKKNILFFDI